MNFGDVLDKWDEQTARPYGKKRIKADAEKRNSEFDESSDADAVIDGRRPQKAINPMEFWMQRYGVNDKDAEISSLQPEEPRALSRKRLLEMRPEASVDLHGLTRDEGWSRLDAFINDAYRQGLKKVQVVHGKGNHSVDEPVLRRMVQLYFEQSDLTGESSFSTKKDMSGGVAWVILRKKKDT